MTKTPEKVAVEQRHRDAAADAYEAIGGCTVPLNFGARVRAGEESELAQAFANFEARLRTPEPTGVEPRCPYCRDLASDECRYC